MGRRGKRESRGRAHSRLPGDRPVPRRPECRALPPLRGQEVRAAHDSLGHFPDGSVNVIGNGVVIDPVILSEEIAGLEADGIDVQGKLLISKKAHLILPTHRAIDAASEAAKGKTKIGSTLKGIGPTYMDKTGRNGLRIGDIVSPEFGERYRAAEGKTPRTAPPIRLSGRPDRLREEMVRGNRESQAFPADRQRACGEPPARRG